MRDDDTHTHGYCTSAESFLYLFWSIMHSSSFPIFSFHSNKIDDDDGATSSLKADWIFFSFFLFLSNEARAGFDGGLILDNQVEK